MDDPLWELFFAETDLDRRPARNYCSRCPVREDCLRHALEHKEIWGIWGGLDEADIRRALWVDSVGSSARRSRYPNCPSCHSRPSSLQVSTICDMRTRRKRERITCRVCDFYWHSPTSAVAVRAYWKERRQRLQERRTTVVPDNMKSAASL